jgi:hypothetical protein
MAQQILDRTQPSAHSLGEGDRKSSTSLSSPTSTSPEPIFEYTEDEERKVRRKLNMIVLPLLFLGFYVFQLERGNIANALTDDFMIKVGITQDQFNTGQALLFVGIILGELPSQYVLQWIGPQVRHWSTSDWTLADLTDLDLVPSPSFRFGRHIPGLSEQLCLVPHYPYPPWCYRVWLHSWQLVHSEWQPHNIELG